MIHVGIVGGAGYIGGELLRLLLGHPEVEVTAVTSTRMAGKRVDGDHPNLRGQTALTYIAPANLPDCDALILAGAGIAHAPELLDRAKVVLDLTPDLRLTDKAAYRRYYGETHPAPELLGSAVSGWPEQNRDALRTADRIAIPGCMANAAILALHPVRDLIGPLVTVDGRVGSSGSGATAGEMNLHAERSGSMRVFAPSGHRHEAEIRQAVGVDVRMTATGIPAVRGVQVVCRADANDGVTEAQVRAAFRASYAGEPFVRVVAAKRGGYRFPEPKILLGSNFCDVGFSLDQESGQLVLIGALDNLVKGGAGNAVQCLNIRFGVPEQLGLGFPGLHPI